MSSFPLLNQIFLSSRHVYADESHWTATEVALDTDHFELNVTSQEKGKERRILKHIPFLVPATTRFRLFAHFIRDDKDQVEANRHWGYSTRIAIRRDSVFEDGYSTLAALPGLLMFLSNSGVKLIVG